tara:strand:- start:10146 stop:12563 length:2418 start_codon:yes stop_codon:yes gene_type:complete
MSKQITKGRFPSQSASDGEKSSSPYGLEIAKAIEAEWFKRDSGSVRYYANRDQFHRLRLYARGEQSIQKYKDELSINGDLSYLNLDWKPVPIIPKFVDIVVNGISERMYDIKAYSQDQASIDTRTSYVDSIVRDMKNKTLFDELENSFSINMYNNDKETLPETQEELELHMQLDYKQSIEIAEEEAINNVFDYNKYDLLKKRLDYDLAVVGIGAVKNSFNTSEGIKIEYVDPADLVYSYTESPYFDDIYYVGEVKRVSLIDLKKQYPELTSEDIEEIEGSSNSSMLYNKSYSSSDSPDNNYVYILYFEYKTFNNQVYKIKETSTGSQKSIKKTDEFNPPKDSENRFQKVNRSIEVIYEGAKIIGSNKLLKWKLAENMTRPYSDITKAQLSYSIVAPRIYKGKIESLVSRMTTFADMVQLTHLKLQQVLSRMVPDGVYLDADGIAEIDLGNGTNYNPQEALNMYFQTGSVIGRSMTGDGEYNHSRMPVQELQSSSGGQKIQSLIQSYNYYLQMIRDVTGLNEARDGSMPDKNALVGLQKLAAANSNVATRHVLQAGLYLTLKTAEAISLRVSDVLQYGNTTQAFVNGVGKFNVASLREIQTLHLHDFGIFLELAPDEEQKQILENNIQMALQQKQIEIEDAIDAREVKNLKLANQLLKLRRKKKFEKDRQLQMENIEAQSRSNAQAAQAAAQSEAQKEQVIMQGKAKMSEIEHQFEIQKLEREAEIKKELMFHEFQLNMQLKQAETQVINTKEEYKENRKDKRTKIQATQQSELINQRQTGKPPKDFESAGFDNLGGFGLEQFDPR